MLTAEFLSGVLQATRTRLPADMQRLRTSHQGSLVKMFADDPSIHFELWLHRNRGRAELGLHFETRDAGLNARLLEYISEELGFLKVALGDGIEAEPWDKGWTRVYLTRPIERLDDQAQTQLATEFAAFIETLEPLRQEAVAAAVR